MNKFLLLFLCMCLVGCSSTPTMMKEKEKEQVQIKPRDLQIVALGDSLTEGVGDEQGGYVTLVKKYVEQREDVNEVFVENIGKRGLRSEQLTDVIMNNESVIRKADVILITIGGNDVMKVVRSHFLSLTYELFVKEQQMFASRLDEQLQLLRHINEDAYIVLIGLYNPFSSAFPNIPEMDEIIHMWNEGSEEVISRYDRTLFVPIADLFEGRDDVLYDDQFHPNTHGYELIAQRIYEYLQKYDEWIGE
ncbi:SGNH/GDSL hydrolase family protein [Anoxybacillus flavithermus]|uniref:Predicted secreted lysophospholipase protein, SGNH-hydrolase superfamily n=1 Tax=Anoxybacillus flavithermus (strain DSM 21510 / WK1) TaxID=491915 RepID=B7GI34_ANOFW|nr:SGNH/GDSL hydrolase family protein [Anoxybacillus flavithermus]ACJ33815.1 Predicted secreted lysophospholipase protein, SGNH-hydrolase superfamily [Anoxybacillus flavithermus WK1]